MTHVADSIIDFDGLQPGIGHLQSPKPAVLRGRNFRWHLRGPYSGWGNSVVAPHRGGAIHKMQATFRMEDRAVLCTDTGIYEMLDGSCCNWRAVCTYTPRIWPDPCDNDYPWTSAYVGDSYFFAHPTVGIIEYSRCEGGWRCQLDLSCTVPAAGGHASLAAELGFEIPTPPATPRFSGYETLFPATPAGAQLIAGPIFAITQANNQLIVLARDTVSWSAPDHGRNLQCDMHTGAGFQSLSVGRYGRPLSVKETVDGFVTYTTNAMLQFRQVQHHAMYRVDEISTAHMPLNPWCIVQHDSKAHFFLAEHGLFVTDGNFPKPFEPVIGQYLAELEIPRNRMHTVQHEIAMFYHPENGEIFISLRHPDPTLRQPHVYTRSLVFNEKYTKWCSFDQPHRWIGPVNFCEQRKSHLSYGFIHADLAVRQFDMSRFNASYNGTDCTCIPAPLDSYIELGPIAPRDQKFIGRNSEFQEYRLHTGPMFTTEQHRHDMSTLFKTDAYEEHTDTWSWYHARSASSTDGYIINNAQWDDGWPVGQNYFTQDYVCNHMGVTHSIMLLADQVGQYYELQRVDFQLFMTVIQ